MGDISWENSKYNPKNNPPSSAYHQQQPKKEFGPIMSSSRSKYYSKWDRDRDDSRHDRERSSSYSSTSYSSTTNHQRGYKRPRDEDYRRHQDNNETFRKSKETSSKQQYPTTNTSSVDDEIIFIGKPRKKKSDAGRIVSLDDDGTARPIKVEIKTEPQYITATPIPTTTTPTTPPPTTTPLPTTPPIPTSSSSSPPSCSSNYPLVGIPLQLKSEFVDVQEATFDDVSSCQQDSGIHEVSVVCQTCYLKISHMCNDASSDENVLSAQKLVPGELYACKCNFLFYHHTNCGGNTKKESFAPEAKQQGHFKQIDRSHGYECHICHFKYNISGIKKDMWFTKLTKTELNNWNIENCPLFKRCDEISRIKYDTDVRQYQSVVSKSELLRSQEEFVGIRRTCVNKCNDNCCKIYHECKPNADEKIQLEEN